MNFLRPFYEIHVSETGTLPDRSKESLSKTNGWTLDLVTVTTFFSAVELLSLAPSISCSIVYTSTFQIYFQYKEQINIVERYLYWYMRSKFYKVCIRRL